MTTARLIWMSVLVLAGLAFLWVLARRRVFDPQDKKAALAFLFVGFAGIFAAGWFLLPAPEEAEVQVPAGLPPVPPA